MNNIENEKIVRVGEHRFDCPVNFMEHIAAMHKENEYMPQHHIKQVQQRVIQHQQQKQIQLQLQQQKTHEMDGPDM